MFERVPSFAARVRLNITKRTNLVKAVGRGLDQRTNLQSTMNAISHDGNEFTIGQATVTVLVEEQENGADDVRTQFRARADFDGSLELICGQQQVKVSRK